LTDRNVKENGEVDASTPSPVLDLAGSSFSLILAAFLLSYQLLLAYLPPDAILLDPRSFHIPPGASSKLPLSEKLRLQLACDAKILDVEQFLKECVVPKDVVGYYDGKVKEEEWKKYVLAFTSSFL
jgi:hypothetical protein